VPEHPVDRRAVRVIDRDRPDRLGQAQTVGVAIDQKTWLAPASIAEYAAPTARAVMVV
jgi:hypothetical protein